MNKPRVNHLLLVLCLLCAPLASAATITTFSGGDPGEGLDLQGTFPYAVNMRGPAVGLIGDANFTDDAAPGVTVSANQEILNWSNPSFGATTNDDRLETVMQSIRWSDAGGQPPYVTITLANLAPGGTYQLQLLFSESCCSGRGFDVRLNGTTIADEFSPAAYVAQNPNPTSAVVVTQTFVAPSSTATIVLDGTTANFQDHNAIIDGLTLELLAAPGYNPAIPALSGRALALLGALLAAVALAVLRGN